jgi:hypothetical protein
MVGLFKGIWRLMTGEVINSADVMVHNGQTIVTLALRRSKDHALFISLKEASAGNIQFVAFEPEQFDQFVATVELIRDALAFERAKPTEKLQRD